MALKDSSISRRSFLRGAATVAAGAAALPALQGLGMLSENGRIEAAPGRGGYGPLVETPDMRDGVARLRLPEGFQYRSFSVAGSTMSDGNLVPLAHDGMASFIMPDGTIRLIRNHEDRNFAGYGSTGGAPKYDPQGGGGTTTLVVDPETRELQDDWVSLAGTIVNCAGGVTPWGSWITCEETNAGPTTAIPAPSPTVPAGLPAWGMQHGYAFDVPAAAEGPVTPVPLTALGRFAHEALAIDPKSGIVYETEDNGNNSGFYRFVPDTKGNLTAGKLQMLAIKGIFKYQAIAGQVVGKKLPVTWVDIADPNPAGTSSTAVFNQGFNLGAARFNRLEGCWWDNQSIYFVSTRGGGTGAEGTGSGQVWQYQPDGKGEGTLTLIFESPSAEVLFMPDNLTVSPNGSILLCEDGDGNQYLRAVTPGGTIFDFAQNIISEDEWAGANFAVTGPGDDGITLFANLFGVSSFPVTGGVVGGFDDIDPDRLGMTVAIWGPWKKGAL